MKTCLHREFDDTCQLFFDLDTEDTSVLYCTEEGECCAGDPNLEECPFYVSVWED